MKVTQTAFPNASSEIIRLRNMIKKTASYTVLNQIRKHALEKAVTESEDYLVVAEVATIKINQIQMLL